jgi:hypothetical protein
MARRNDNQPGPSGGIDRNTTDDHVRIRRFGTPNFN